MTALMLCLTHIEPGYTSVFCMHVTVQFESFGRLRYDSLGQYFVQDKICFFLDLMETFMKKKNWNHYFGETGIYKCGN